MDLLDSNEFPPLTTHASATNLDFMLSTSLSPVEHAESFNELASELDQVLKRNLLLQETRNNSSDFNLNPLSDMTNEFIAQMSPATCENVVDIFALPFQNGVDNYSSAKNFKQSDEYADTFSHSKPQKRRKYSTESSATATQIMQSLESSLASNGNETIELR